MRESNSSLLMIVVEDALEACCAIFEEGLAAA
jgi:hypothetical protein